MACRASALSWNIFGHGGISASMAAAKEEPGRSAPVADSLCRALAESIADVASMEEPELHAAGHTSGSCGHCEAVQRCLGAVLQRLEDLSSATRPGDSEEAARRQEGRALVAALLAADAPAQLVACLDRLGFEARKEAMRLFSALLRLALPLGADAALVDYLRGHPRIAELLLEGSGRPRVFAHCAQMLRACTRYPQLVEGMLAVGAARRLIELAQNQSFDISSEAFASLRELLLAQRAVSASYLAANFEEFFADYHTLLQANMDYVSRRQALRLLGDLLLDRAFMDVMVAYVTNEQFLQIHMNLLRDTAKSIQLDAFHVFKIFVANPQKPYRVHNILHRNKDRLLKLLGTLSPKKEVNAPFDEDLRVVIRVLKALEAPARPARAELRLPELAGEVPEAALEAVATA